MIEYCYGEPLDSVIRRAISEHNETLLYDKLRALAYFLATLHNHSARPVMVDFHRICNYFETLLHQLHNILTVEEHDFLYRFADSCRHNQLMYQDQEVLVHGDATPSNFFFGSGMHVITFDLERMHRSDRLFDTGRIAGELQHFFLQQTGNRYSAEPFIGHFLWEYASHFPDRARAFASITARVPFYMGMTLLRIARNLYLDYAYRRKLITEAVNILWHMQL
jgi:aminoglycoside phosphotransferase (APT) family kinase protein